MSGTDETIYVCQCAQNGQLCVSYERTEVGKLWVWVLTFALPLTVSACTWSVDGYSPVNSSMLVLLVKPSICYCHASEAVLAISCYKHTQETHTQNTPWPPADCVWTPGQDLEASRIPAGWELNSLDYPTIHLRVHQHVTSHSTSVTFKCTHSNRNGCKDMTIYVFKHWCRIKK